VNRRLLAAAAVAAVSLGAARSSGAQGTYPTTPPAPLPVRPAHLPPFQEATLANGVHLLVIESHRAPVVSMSLSFKAGAASDPAGKEGVAGIAAGLLTKGAGSRSADEISAAIEGVGGSIGAGAGTDFLTVGVDAPSPSAELAMGLLADAAARPTFPDKEVELARTQTLSGLQLQLSDPSAIAARTFARELYGKSAYARSATPASVKAITRADLVAFQQARLRPQGALLVVAGDITLARAKSLAEAALKGWTGASATRRSPRTTRRSMPRRSPTRSSAAAATPASS
jgi:zinc protease